jgi:3-oxoacyl-[acyl-carrier protein] reductase
MVETPDSGAIFVAGAAGGIGRAVANLAATEGRPLFLTDADPAVERVAAELRAGGAEALAASGDLGDEESVARLADLCGRELGPVGALVIAAGVVHERLPVAQLPVEAWDRTIAVNLRAPFLLTHHLGPTMPRGSSIVTFSSIAARAGRPGGAAYSASKAAVEALTRSLAAELGPAGVTVNAIAPGFVDTAMTRKGMRWTAEAREIPLQQVRGEREATIPVGRLASAEEVAHCVSFLCSRAARYITGSVLEVDGGVLVGY